MLEDDHNRVFLIILVAALIVGTAGYLMGTSGAVEPRGYREATEQPTLEDVDGVPTQEGMASDVRGPNRTRFTKALEALLGERRALADEVGRPTESEWNESIARRGELRAFDGAPPVVPHDITQRNFPSCVACHVDGLVIEGRTAPAMSHELMANCTQCHVVSEGPVPGDAVAGGPPSTTAFRGIGRSGRGDRAWVGAPPTIPHTTHLRDRCDSCHGVLATGLRTSHACQQNCQQCHTGSSGLDQQPATTPPSPGAAGGL